MQLHVVLFEPEIPQNTGNIARTCAAVGASLHLIEPLGFSLESRYVKRAGLDYWDDVDLRLYQGFDHFLETSGCSSLYFFTTKTRRYYTEIPAAELSCVTLVFGKETAGLPARIREQYQDRCVTIPMRHGTRSLNLSNSAAVAVYEVLRQQGFPHAAAGA